MMIDIDIDIDDDDDDDDDEEENQPTLTGKDEKSPCFTFQKNQGTAPRSSVCHNSASCLGDDLDFSPNPAGSRFSRGTNPSNWILSPILGDNAKKKMKPPRIEDPKNTQKYVFFLDVVITTKLLILP